MAGRMRYSPRGNTNVFLRTKMIGLMRHISSRPLLMINLPEHESWSERCRKACTRRCRADMANIKVRRSGPSDLRLVKS